MKRILGAAFCLLMLFSMVSLFSSCGAGAKKKVDLSDYAVIYGAKGISGSADDRIFEFSEAMNASLGTDAYYKADFGQETVASDDHEILIGDTARVESAEAKDRIKGDGYCIEVTKNKIVIVGSSTYFTLMALDVFEKEYFSEKRDNATLQIRKRTVASNLPVLVFDASYSYVYSAALDDQKGCAYGDSYVKTTENPDAFDYPVVAAQRIAKALGKVLNVENPVSRAVKDNAPAGEHEVLVGDVDREAARTAAAKLDADRYSVTLSGGKVIISARNDVTLRAGVTAFLNMVTDCTVTNADGNSEIRLPADYEKVFTYKNARWISDFPQPEGEGIELSGSVDVYDSTLEYYYTGSGVTAAAFRAYCGKLEAAGYTRYMENEIAGSLFATYINDQNTIHVAYNAFEYLESAENITQNLKTCLRVITSPRNAVNLVPESVKTQNLSYKKVTDTKITSVRLDRPTNGYVRGNAYIMTLEDGSFIVLDGGVPVDNDYNKTRLYNVLCDLHRQVYGTAPSAENPIVISAWYLTHLHNDHFQNFRDLLQAYGSQMECHYLIANFASDSETYNCFDPNPSLRDGINAVLKYPRGGMTYVKVHTGQKLYFANVEMEVLCTHEDLYPNRVLMFNDTSTAIRFTTYTTDGKGNITSENPTTSIWLGDLFEGGSQFMRANYGSYLESDMVQVAHHGYNGCELEFYKQVNARIVWFPHGSGDFWWLINPDACKDYWQAIDRAVAFDLPRVEYVITMDGYNTTVTFDKNGNPDFENLTNIADGYAQSGVPIQYGTYVIRVKDQKT